MTMLTTARTTATIRLELFWAAHSRTRSSSPSAMAMGTASSYPGAAQPGATSNRGPVVTVAVGSFNFGVDQNMLKPERWAKKHCANFRRVCAEMVFQGNLDIMFGCELGGSGQGFRCGPINVKDILEEPFGDISFAEVDNYIALCRFRQSAVVLHAPRRSSQ